jgi:hypothetical protein
MKYSVECFTKFSTPEFQVYVSAIFKEKMTGRVQDHRATLHIGVFEVLIAASIMILVF